MSVDAKAQVLETVESSAGSKRKVLSLGVPKSDCYRWRARHGQGSLRIEGIQAHPGTA